MKPKLLIVMAIVIPTFLVASDIKDDPDMHQFILLDSMKKRGK